MKILKNIIQNIGNKKNFTFVSVGANNGIFVDEVFQSKLLNINWNCYFIEPVKETFELLVKNYSEHYPNNRFVYDNCAIHINEGEDYLVTNKVDDSRGMCSFFRNETDDAERILVNKKTFKSFLSKHQITKIDFLKIDCEGMDYEIILQCLDLGIYPDVILFEDIFLNLEGTNVRGMGELINKINTIGDYELINDFAEFQYEESNKLIIKKELLKYVQNT
jgi:FkbM family methyltransferase